jgi:hypothetical protein
VNPETTTIVDDFTGGCINSRYWVKHSYPSNATSGNIDTLANENLRIITQTDTNGQSRELGVTSRFSYDLSQGPLFVLAEVQPYLSFEKRPAIVAITEERADNKAIWKTVESAYSDPELVQKFIGLFLWKVGADPLYTLMHRDDYLADGFATEETAIPTTTYDKQLLIRYELRNVDGQDNILVNLIEVDLTGGVITKRFVHQWKIPSSMTTVYVHLMGQIDVMASYPVSFDKVHIWQETGQYDYLPNPN